MITFHKLQAIKGKQRKIETDYKFGNKPRKESCSSYSQNLDQISTLSINSPLFSLQNGQNEKDIYQKIQKANNQDNDSYDIYTTYTQSQSPVQFVQKQQELADISALQLNELSQKEQQTEVYGQRNEEIKNKLDNQELEQFENLQKKCIRKRGRPKKVLNQEELKKMQLKKGAFKIKNTDDIIFYKQNEQKPVNELKQIIHKRIELKSQLKKNKWNDDEIQNLYQERVNKEFKKNKTKVEDALKIYDNSQNIIKNNNQIQMDRQNIQQQNIENKSKQKLTSY